MTTKLQLSGSTVTVYGDRDALDAALNDELGRRGCSTHSISAPLGWLQTVSYAVLRVGSRSGERALAELADQDGPARHVVAVCESGDQATTDRIEQLCRRCGEHHDVSLIWHDPLDDDLMGVGDLFAPTGRPTADDLASTIVDAVGVQRETGGGPAFAEQTYGLHR